MRSASEPHEAMVGWRAYLRAAVAALHRLRDADVVEAGRQRGERLQPFQTSSKVDMRNVAGGCAHEGSAMLHRRGGRLKSEPTGIQEAHEQLAAVGIVATPP